MSGVWNVVYNSEKYGVCLERLVYGTRERAEEIAKGCGEGYWVEDGAETAKALCKD